MANSAYVFLVCGPKVKVNLAIWVHSRDYNVAHNHMYMNGCLIKYKNENNSANFLTICVKVLVEYHSEKQIFQTLEVSNFISLQKHSVYYQMRSVHRHINIILCHMSTPIHM